MTVKYVQEIHIGLSSEFKDHPRADEMLAASEAASHVVQSIVDAMIAVALGEHNEIS